MKLLTFVLWASSFATLASAASYRLTLYEKSTVAGKELAPGEYKVELNGEKAKISSGKQMVETMVKVENGGEKYASTTVRYSNGDGKYRLMEIRLGGTNTKLVFDN
jgi:hypothetical protein